MDHTQTAVTGQDATTTTSAAAASPDASSAAASAPAAGGVLAKLSAVAVGTAISATSADGKPIIIAQPRAGDVVAFTAICTHMGCTVKPESGTVLKCPCHGSTYDAATGKNTGGPAPRPLAEVPVKVSGDSIVAG